MTSACTVDTCSLPEDGAGMGEFSLNPFSILVLLLIIAIFSSFAWYMRNGDPE